MTYRRDNFSRLPAESYNHVLQAESIVNHSAVSVTAATNHFPKDFDQWTSWLSAKATVTLILYTAVQLSGDLGFSEKPLDCVTDLMIVLGQCLPSVFLYCRK